MDYSYFDKIWNLLDCDSVLLPPDGCLQFHTGASGVIKSFNSDVTAPRLITLASSNLEYNICIRQEDGKLSISYRQKSSATSSSYFLLLCSLCKDKVIFNSALLFTIEGRCTMNLSETRPEATPNSYLLDGTTTATSVCTTGTCLIIDGSQFGGQIFSSVSADVISGVVTGITKQSYNFFCIIVKYKLYHLIS